MTVAPVQYYTGNAFTSTPHGGGQAAILILPSTDARLHDEEFKAATARDFNLPMIAFHSLLEDGDVPLYSVEWRLPDGNEAPLCGHASLVGAHTIFSLHPEAKAVEFKTNARGIVRAEKYDNGEIGIELPLQAAGVPTAEEKARLGHILASAAGLPDDAVLEVTTWQEGGAATAEIGPEVDLGNIKVDIEALRAIPHHAILTQLVGTGEDGVRINSRVFIPNWGVLEDPVCGSGHSAITAHYLLGPASSRVSKLVAGGDASSATLDAKQLSERGGALKTSLAGKNVRLVGRAWRTGRGELEVF